MDRIMRMIVCFDLPVNTLKERRDYARFRKNLTEAGFYMLQESVYVKIVLNPSAKIYLEKYLKSIAPSKGLVQSLVITEKQFNNIFTIVGNAKTEFIHSGDKVIFV